MEDLKNQRVFIIQAQVFKILPTSAYCTREQIFRESDFDSVLGTFPQAEVQFD